MANPELKPREARGLGWLWGLLALLAVVLVVWWFVDGPVDEGTPPVEARIEQREAESPVTEVEDPEQTGEAPAAAAITAGEILDNPAVWQGIGFVGEVRVTEVASPRSFWVQDPAAPRDEARELLVVLDPDGGDHGIEAGDTLDIEEAIVRDPTYAANLGDALDAATRDLVEQQAVFLTAHPTDVVPAATAEADAGTG
jgi:hypothetical protein